ncbi:MAG: HEAT repeat domain-containing protein [Candidatus Brocadiae bacterium]|nr:HEAT repeat domain-containing protein [Candidatus Brocadiia bacterium]
MGKEEFYSLDQLYDKHKGDKDVKTLISEGAIKVFREANQIKFKAEQEQPQENSKKNRSISLEKEEKRFYSLFCQKLQQECWIMMAISGILSGFLFLFYAIFLRKDPGIWLDIALFTSALAQVFFLCALGMSLFASLFLSQFDILNSQDLSGDKKKLLALFNKGYSYKQGTKNLVFVGLVCLVFFLFFYLAHTSIILSILSIVVVAVIFGWSYFYLKMLQRLGMVHTQHKLFSPGTEEVANSFQTDKKVEIEEKIILSGIQAILQSHSVKVRQNAVKALGRLSTQESIYILAKNLGDSVPEVRAQVAAVLGKSGEKSVCEPLKCLLNDEAPEVRVAVAEALGKLKDETAIDSLIDALDDSCPEVRGAASEALGNLKNKKSIKPLLSQIKDKDWFVRHKVILSLGKIKEELPVEGIEKLMQATEDENEYVSVAARHVLKKISGDMSHQDPLYEEVTEALEQEAAKKQKKQETPDEKENAEKNPKDKDNPKKDS